MKAPARAALTARLLGFGVAIVGAALLAILLLWGLSSSFSASLELFFLGPFRNAWYFGNMLAEASVLVLAGLGAAVAFGSRNFNLGGEGQVYAGAIAAAAILLGLPTASPPLGIGLALLGSALAGAALAWFSGRLKLSLGVDELISSFLASAIFVYLGGFLISGPLQDPSSNFQSTASIAPAFRLARLFPPSNLSTAAFASLFALGLAMFLSKRTRLGFEFGLVGRNAEFARYAGIDTGFYVTAPMALSGALYGLAGAFLLLGTQYKAMKGFTSGIGWSGIAVALVAGNSPSAILPSALLFAYLDTGAKAVMIGSDVTGDIVSVIQATVFFLVTARAADGLFGTRASRLRAGGKKAR